MSDPTPEISRRVNAAADRLHNAQPDDGYRMDRPVPFGLGVVVAAEQDHGVVFPPDYRHFLVEHGWSRSLECWVHRGTGRNWMADVVPQQISGMIRDIRQHWDDDMAAIGISWDGWHNDLIPFAFYPHDDYWCFDFSFDAANPPVVSRCGAPPAISSRHEFDGVTYLASSFLEMLEDTIYTNDPYSYVAEPKPGQSDREKAWLRWRNERLSLPAGLGIG